MTEETRTLEKYGLGMDRSALRLVPHDSSWTEAFRVESQRIRGVLASVMLGIEHIGSTAVPDLIAKPILDMGILVAGAGDFEACVDPLASLGYTDRGRNGDDPLRRYFVLEQGDRRLVQLHVWCQAAAAWDEALAFRDLLRRRPDLRAAYAAEKRRVAEAVDGDKSRYAIEKGPFIEAVLRSEGIRANRDGHQGKRAATMVVE